MEPRGTVTWPVPRGGRSTADVKWVVNISVGCSVLCLMDSILAVRVARPPGDGM